MQGIINVLPDAIANQIAAGEVVQRPASVVKELLENSIDAGASKIKLIIKEAGKTLIQVVDNGCGMSGIDARLCFERHATSKIKEVKDIFNIHTKGFRGEALASIAAVAHTELRTKRREDETGTLIQVEGSEFKANESVACPSGTQFSIKNLFFNTPARRNFLKSNGVEFKHIVDEFQRVALAHPDIKFELIHNDQEVFVLPSANKKKRVVDVLGKKMEKNLINLEVETSVVKIKGFIADPKASVKSRGDQFLFVNDRFIKSPFFHHAISKGYENLIAPGTHPKYFLFFELDPNTVDINIHPTKTEIKFQHEKEIYAILLSAVKEALGKNNMVPSIDFENPEPIDMGLGITPSELKQPTITINPNYNPFTTKTSSGGSGGYDYGKKAPMKNQSWETLQQIQKEFEVGLEKEMSPEESVAFKDQEASEEQAITPPQNQSEKTYQSIQVAQSYLVTSTKTGLIIIDQNKAHQRILFDRFMNSFSENSIKVQKLMFPESVQIPNEYHDLIEANLDLIRQLGLEIDKFGKNEFVINGVPSGIPQLEYQDLVNDIIDELAHGDDLKSEMIQAQIARVFARNSALKKGKSLNSQEIQNLIDELFSCSNPTTAPNGKPTFLTFTSDDLFNKFNA